MADLVNVGKNAVDVTTSDIYTPYSKVIVICSEEDESGGTTVKQYEAGDDTGLTLEVNCPWGTQEMANNILANVRDKCYRPYDVSTGLLDPATEIGDAVLTNGVFGGLYNQESTFGHSFYSDYSAPTDEEMSHEYKYEPSSERKIYRELNETKATFKATTSEINAEVSKKVASEGGQTYSFGWRLNDNAFNLYSTSKTVFKCDKDGLVVDGDGTFSGTINATAGKIGRGDNVWNIGEKSIYNGTDSIVSSTRGTYVGTDGIRIYKDDKNSFTCTNGGALEIKKGMTSMEDTGNSSGYYIGTDGIVFGGGKLKLEKDGTFTAQKGVIGNGTNAWQIGSKSLFNGTDSLSSEVQGTYVGTDGIRVYNDFSNSFTFNKNGNLEIKKGMSSIDDSSSSSGYYIGNDGIALGGGKLRLSKDGTLIAKQGVIGSDANAWNIGAKSIYNGTTSLSDTTQGTYVGIDGIRVYNDDKNSFTFNKNGNLEIKKGMTDINDTSNSTGMFIGNYGIVLGGGKLKLTRDGTLTAKKGVIGSDTNAWNIGAKSIYNGTTSISDTNEGAYIGIDGIRIFNNSQNSFTFRKNGTLEIKKGMNSLDDEANASGMFIGNDGIALGGGKFKVTKSGVLTAKSGEIAGWEIKENALEKTVESGGVVSSHVGMASTGGYAFYAGKSTNPASCQFAVTKDGFVYLNKLFTRKLNTDDPRYDPDNPTTWEQCYVDSEVDLRNNGYKISGGYNTIKSYNASTGRVTMSNGVSFSTATSAYLVASWSGGSNPDGSVNGRINIDTMVPTKTDPISSTYIQFVEDKTNYRIKLQSVDNTFNTGSAKYISIKSTWDYGRSLVDVDRWSYSAGYVIAYLSNGTGPYKYGLTKRTDCVSGLKRLSTNNSVYYGIVCDEDGNRLISSAKYWYYKDSNTGLTDYYTGN